MDRDTRTTLIYASAYLARAIVGLALVAAGTIKAVHPATFVGDIWSYRLVPESWGYWIAAFLPWLEIVTGAALVTNRQRRGAQALAGLMLVAFLIAIGTAWARGLDISCGCFGGSAPGDAAPNYLWLVVRDLLLLAGLAFGALADRRTGDDRAASVQAGTLPVVPR